MGIQLPKNWNLTPLGKLANYINGRGFKKNEWKQQGIPIIRIQNLNKINAPFNYADEGFEDKYKIRDGDLLVSWSATLDVFIWSRGDAWLNQHIFKVESDFKKTNKNFLYYALKESLNELYRKAHGSGMVHITKGVFEEHQIQVPPFPEQKRIADKLYCLLTKVDTCKARLDKVPEIIKRFRQSVLADATSGRLTKKWRFENDISFPWNISYLTDVSNSKLGKMLDKAKNKGNPIKYLRNINVRWFNFDLSDLHEMAITDKEIPKYEIRDSDVLICEGGEPGRAAVWNLGNNDLVFQKAIHRVRLNPEVNPYWFLFNLKNDFNNGKLAKLYTGTTIKHLTGRSLKTYQFTVPKIVEQKEIVKRVDALFSIADQMEEKLKRAQSGVDKLTASILAKAFKGELVPQESR